MNEITWFLFGVAVGIWLCVLAVKIYLRHKAKHYKHGAPKPDYTIDIPQAHTPAPPQNKSAVYHPIIEYNCRIDAKNVKDFQEILKDIRRHDSPSNI